MQPGEFRIVHNADFDWGQRGYDDELRFAAGLTEDERAETGTPARWSARDVIAHNAAWKQRAATILSCAARGETPPAFDDEDRLNAETFESNRERPWPLVLADAEQALADLRAAVLALDEPQWTDPGRFPWRKGRPLWLLAYGNAYSHPQWHLGLWQLARRGVAGATQVHERLADTQRRLDDSPQSRATATYNLACFYSLSGQRDRALAALAEALKTNPNLVELSKTDTDLDGLRGDPALPKLYQEIASAG